MPHGVFRMSNSSRPPSIPLDRLKMLAVIGLAVFGAGGAAYSYDAGVVKGDDLQVHVGTAHMVQTVDGNGHEELKPIVDVVAANHKALAQLPAMKKAIDEASANSLAVKNGFFDEHASRIGSRAADSLPRGTHWRKRKILADQVKRTALGNLNAGRDIDVGIEQYAF